MSRGSALSDKDVIKKINEEFVTVEINITDGGFPKDVPALALWQKAFEKDPRYRFGFATSVVVGPEGKVAYGTSGCGHTFEWDTSISYHPEKYVAFLDESLARFKKALGIVHDGDLSDEERAAKLKELQAETLKALYEATRCRRPEKR